ncbi:MAG: class I SAM-dependent methyltransferase [Thermodesulfobacteriota bacterium]
MNAPVPPALLDLPRCPGLKRWTRINGYFDVAEALAMQELVASLPQGARVAELGTFQGRSAVAIACALPPGGVLFCVDHFVNTVLAPGQAKPPLEEVVRTNLAALAANLDAFGVRDRVTVLRGRTRDAAQRFEPGSLDLVFVDAGHQYEEVSADLADWHPKVRPGGWLVCDDYTAEWPGVVRAIEETRLPGQFLAPTLWAHRKPGS